MANRIVSVDVLRGLTIAFMIIVNTPGSWSYVYSPLKHADWHGCTPTDLVFPSFLFVVGLSMYISFKKLIYQTSKSTLVLQVLKRASLIFVIGLLLNWFPFVGRSLENLRIFGVLQRIACAYLLAGFLIVIFKNIKVLGVISILLMLCHWWILDYYGCPDPYSLDGNIGTQIDQWLVGDHHMYKGFGIPFDPEGLLGTISSGAHVIIGYLSADVVLNKVKKTPNFCLGFAGVGVGFIFVSWLLCHLIPINKPLWTPSYVFHTIGYLYIIWAGLIYVVDVLGYEKSAFPFIVFGRNPLISFILSVLIVKIMIYIFKFNETNLYAWSYENIFQLIFGHYFGSFLFAIAITFIVWLFAFWLYRKGKAIRV